MGSLCGQGAERRGAREALTSLRAAPAPRMCFQCGYAACAAPRRARARGGRQTRRRSRTAPCSACPESPPAARQVQPGRCGPAGWVVVFAVSVARGMGRWVRVRSRKRAGQGEHTAPRGGGGDAVVPGLALLSMRGSRPLARLTGCTARRDLRTMPWVSRKRRSVSAAPCFVMRYSLSCRRSHLPPNGSAP